MALAYLLDEQLRGPLWRAIRRHNQTRVRTLDVLRVGEDDAPPLGTPDQELLIWAELTNRILITLDQNTMVQHLTEHLAGGRHSPGAFVIRQRQALHDILELSVVAAFACDESEFQDRVFYIP